jgi:LPXTG-site transpeptidase (sortase) family protein
VPLLALVVAVLVVSWLVPGVPGLPAHDAPGPGSEPTVVTGQSGRQPAPDTATTDRTAGTSLEQRIRSLAGVALTAAGVPERLVVRRLSVRSDVVPISGNSGTLLPPSDPRLLGWWQEGAVPGAARGTAVLTGHTVHTGGGAFDDLSSLVRGDRVRVDTTRGTITYAVTSVRDLGTDELAHRSRRTFRLGGAGRLVLVTCTDWNGRDYLSNTVVVARPVAAR